MATCYNDKLLFIHIPRCGGTSVSTYLNAAIPGMDCEPFPIGHIRLEDVEYFTGRNPESFEKIIAIVRNPFDLEVSNFNYARLMVIGRRVGQLWHFQSMSHRNVSTACQDPFCKFNFYYETNFFPSIYGHCMPSLPQVGERIERLGLLRYWVTVDGKVPDNVHVVTFENIECIAEVTSEYRNTEVLLQHLNGTKSQRDTRNRFDRQARDFVYRNYRWAIENFYPELLAA